MGHGEHLCSCCTRAREQDRQPQQPGLLLLLQPPAHSQHWQLLEQTPGGSTLQQCPKEWQTLCGVTESSGLPRDMATAGTMLALGEKASESPKKASTTLNFRHRQSSSDPGAARAGSGTPGVSQPQPQSFSFTEFNRLAKQIFRHLLHQGDALVRPKR